MHQFLPDDAQVIEALMAEDNPYTTGWPAIKPAADEVFLSLADHMPNRLGEICIEQAVRDLMQFYFRIMAAHERAHCRQAFNNANSRA